ncbi:hypothetical protein EPUL_006358, partial [Erysiphe pulchra]
MLFKSLIASLAAAQLVAGHGAITGAVGDMGGNGTAIGSEYTLYPHRSLPTLWALASFPFFALLLPCHILVIDTDEQREVDPATPRDGTKKNPFQNDSTRFKNNNADACGETVGGGPNDPVKGVAKVVKQSNGMPMISAGGMVMMTLHQVNGDGAGPYKCMIDSTGTGKGGWTKMEVVTNVPGKNSRSKAKATDFPLTAKVAADQTCTGNMGGMDNVCMV